ncbi:hypothetical protein GCM10020331_003550 [Ectobacillus funiculus]
MGAGLLIACSFFIFGSLAHKFLGIPGPVLMIVAATLVKCLKVMPAKMEQGAYHLYKFVSTSLTWPLMVGLGILYIPLEDVVKIVTPAYVVVCSAVVVAMVGTGYVVGKFMNLYPVDSAIVTGCHSGLGGTGDVAIFISFQPYVINALCTSCNKTWRCWHCYISNIANEIIKLKKTMLKRVSA